jgi:hypothetical protein
MRQVKGEDKDKDDDEDGYFEENSAGEKAILFVWD